MNHIILSIQPQCAQMILNREKTYEVRKHALKTGDVVYGYVTKYGPDLVRPTYSSPGIWRTSKSMIGWTYSKHDIRNGLIPFRFVVGEVITFKALGNNQYDVIIPEGDAPSLDLIIAFCSGAKLTQDQIDDYSKGKNVYFHEITNIEIFDKPLSLGDFATANQVEHGMGASHREITRAPQSFQYVIPKGE